MFAGVSDAHLRRTTWARQPELWGDAYFSLEQIVDYCLAHSLPLVAAGDMFDKQLPDAASVAAMCRQLDRLRDARLPAYFTQGQHERSTYETWMGVHPWPQHIHKRLVEIDGYQLYGLDWTPADRVKAELAAVPGSTDFLIAHQVWQEFIPFGPECSFTDVPVQYMLTGDFHEHHVRTAVNARGERLIVASPGSMHMQATDEPPQKAFFHCLIHNGDFEFRSVRLRTRPFFKFEIPDVATLLQVVDQELPQIVDRCLADQSLPEHIRRPIVAISYDSELETPGGATAYNVLRDATPEVFVFLNPYWVEVEQAPIRLPSLDVQSNVLQACLDEIEPPGPVRDTVLRLLNASDPKAEIEAMAVEVLAAAE